MAIGFGSFKDDDEDTEEGSILFSIADRREERQRKLERAKEIASGFASGMFERDEEVWEMVRQIRESE